MILSNLYSAFSECNTLLDKCAVIVYIQLVMKGCSEIVYFPQIMMFSLVLFLYLERKCIPQLWSCIGECSFPIFWFNSSGLQHWYPMVGFELSVQVGACKSNQTNLTAKFLSIVHVMNKKPATGFCKLFWTPHTAHAISSNIICRNTLHSTHDKSGSCILHLLQFA